MKIAFDAKRIFYNTTGLGNYSRTLIDNLCQYHPENEYLLFTPSTKESLYQKKYANRFKTMESNTRFKKVWRSYAIRKDLEAERVDLYHGLSNEIPFWLKKTKTIVTIHDVIFKILPDTYPKLDRWMYEEKTRYACKYADKIIAISENTKRDLIKFYEVPQERIKVIYQPCDAIFYENQNPEYNFELPSNLKHLPSEYLLNVGSIIERKNLLSLVKAVQMLPQNFQLPIVVVGTGKSYKKKIQQYLQSHRLQHLVYWIDNLSAKEDLKKIYQRATMLVYPSLYEGFGLPIVEAMLCGTPVITSNTSSLPEAAGEYAKCINPKNIPEMSAAIRELLDDTQLRKERSEKGREDAEKRFNPQKLTDKVVDLYREVVNNQ